MSDPIEEILIQARSSFYENSMLGTEERNQALLSFADLIQAGTSELLQANAKDLEEQKGKLSPALFQRLGLDQYKIAQIAQGVRDVAKLPDPSGRILDELELDDGLVLQKVSVPLGVLAIVFESRPEVLPQILSLVLKSGNAAVLKPGSESAHSVEAFMEILIKLRKQHPRLPEFWGQVVDSREDFRALLSFPQYVDLVIPRGSNQLVRSVMESTVIPVLGHADGICHIYVDEGADESEALKIIRDAKLQYPSACNAVETLLIHDSMAESLLPQLLEWAHSEKVELRACERTKKIAPQLKTATDQDWVTEYGEPVLAIRIVDDLVEAIAHINRYGSHHTDAIISKFSDRCELFLKRVDSACVFSNASTRFADGFRFGMGAEVGISTNKTHARGPVGIEGLVIYKYLLRGEGQVVASYTGAKAKAFTHRRLKRSSS